MISACFSSDGRRVLTGGNDGRAIVWEAATGRAIRALDARHEEVESVAFSRDGKRAMITSEDPLAMSAGGAAQVFDLATGKSVQAFPPPAGAPGWNKVLFNVTLSPAGDRLLATRNGELSIWDFRKRRRMRKLTEAQEPVRHVVFSPDGKAIAAMSKAGMATLLDASTGRKIRVFGSKERQVRSVRFRPDSKAILLGITNRYGKEGRTDLRDIDTGQSLCTWEGVEDGYDAIAFSPDGKMVAVGKERRVELRSLHDGQVRDVIKLFGTTNRCRTAVFSPDGKYLVIGTDGWVVLHFEFKDGEIGK